MLKLVDPEDAYEIHVLLIRHGRRTCTARNPDCAELPAPADVPVRAEAPRPYMSEPNLRRVSELALIAIASVWGLTFVMVKDAIEELPTMAFLAYRFIPAVSRSSRSSSASSSWRWHRPDGGREL